MSDETSSAQPQAAPAPAKSKPGVELGAELSTTLLAAKLQRVDEAHGLVNSRLSTVEEKLASEAKALWDALKALEAKVSAKL